MKLGKSLPSPCDLWGSTLSATSNIFAYERGLNGTTFFSWEHLTLIFWLHHCQVLPPELYTAPDPRDHLRQRLFACRGYAQACGPDKLSHLVSQYKFSLQLTPHRRSLTRSRSAPQISNSSSTTAPSCRSRQRQRLMGLWRGHAGTARFYAQTSIFHA